MHAAVCVQQNKGGAVASCVVLSCCAFILGQGDMDFVLYECSCAPSTRVAYWAPLGCCDQHHENSLLLTAWQRSSATARGYDRDLPPKCAPLLVSRPEDEGLNGSQLPHAGGHQCHSPLCVPPHLDQVADDVGQARARGAHQPLVLGGVLPPEPQRGQPQDGRTFTPACSSTRSLRYRPTSPRCSSIASVGSRSAPA
jgi:hypothetical protein